MTRWTDEIERLKAFDRLRSNWRNIPITLGFLGAIAAAIAFGIAATSGIRDYVDRMIERSLSSHNVSWTIHEPIRELIDARHSELSKRINSIDDRLTRIENNRNRRR